MRSKGLGDVKAKNLRSPMAGDGGMVGAGKPSIVRGVGITRAGLVPSGVGCGKEASRTIAVGSVAEGGSSSRVEACGIPDIRRAFEMGGGIADEECGVNAANKAKGIKSAGEEKVAAQVKLRDESFTRHWVAGGVAGGALEFEILCFFVRWV